MPCPDRSTLSSRALHGLSNVSQGKGRILINILWNSSSRDSGLHGETRSVTVAEQCRPFRHELSGMVSSDGTVAVMPRPGGKVSCLLKMMHEQARLQHHLWLRCSRLKFLTKEGYMSLHQLRARRLRSLLALARRLDERDFSKARLAARSGEQNPAPHEFSIKNNFDGEELQVELSQLSLEK